MGMIGNSLAQGLISGANIQDGTVDTPDIKDSAVTAAKIASAVVTPAKMDFSAGTANGVLFLNGSKVVSSGSGLTFNSSGFLGIGQTSPTYLVDILADTGTLLVHQTRARVIDQERYIGGITGGGYSTGTTIVDAAQIVFSSTGAWTSTSTPSYIAFGTTASGSTTLTERARIDSNGKFFIGGNASDLSSTSQAMIMGSGGLAVQYTGTTGTYLKVTPGAADGVVDIRADARSGGYPALTFTTGAAERARIDASGNFGVGTNSPLAKLDIKGDTTSYGTMSKIYLTDSNSNTASRNWSIGNGGSAFGNLTFSVSAAKDGNAGDSTSLVRMVIDPGGNVGLATPSPSARLTIGLQSYTASATSGMIRFKNDQTTADGCIQSYSVSSTTGTDIVIGSNFYITTSGGFDRFNASRESSYQIVSRDGTIYWGTGGTGATAVDRMRLDSSGNFMVGVTSPLASSTFSVKGPNNSNQQPVAIWNPGSSGTRYLISFATDTTYGERGYITYNGSTVAIAQASDERLKENIVDAPSALSTISAIQIRSFDFKADGRHVEFGVVAQELHGVVPSAVFEGADNEDGTVNKPWSVGLEPVVPILVKAIQEQQAIIESLTERITALETP